MAALDNDQLVVRVVYTGPPMAGKTQSLRALLPLLRGKGAEEQLLSPGESRGRTAFFDWADYEGGAYEGRAIRCQILSTPGQVALSDRRELLLRGADAVILVVASQAEALERAAQCYEEMAPWLAHAGRDVPIRLILQCNKQDLPGALPAEDIACRLALPCGNDVHATSARTGRGLRAAFVAGVRRAVERARALVHEGLPLDAPDISSGKELLARMRRDVARLRSNPRSATPASTAGWPALSRDARGASSSARDDASSTRPGAPPARPPAKASRSGLYPASGAGSRAAVPSRLVAASGASAVSGSSAVSGGGAPASTPTAATLDRSPTAAVSAPSSRVVSDRATGGASSSAEARARLTTSRAAAPPLARDAAARAAPRVIAARAQGVTVRAPASLPPKPAASAREAIAPPPVEPESDRPTTDEAAALDQATPRREKGSLDPAGAAARAWRPGSGPRPAVMLATAYHVWVPAPTKPSSPVALRRATNEAPSEQPGVAPLVPAAAKARPRIPGEARAVEQRARYVAGSVRPAVMPASVYFAELGELSETGRPGAPVSEAAPAPEVAQTRGELSATPEATPIEVPAAAPVARAAPEVAPVGAVQAPARRELHARPAVMPASAYFAWLAAGVTVMPARMSPAAGSPEARSGRATAAASDPASGGSAIAGAASPGLVSAFVRPDSSVDPPVGVQKPARPAVMPASAWRAPLASVGALGTSGDKTGAPVPLRLLQGGTRERRADAPRPAGQRPALTLLPRPAVMPASAWRAVPQAHVQAAAARDAARRDVAQRPAVMPASAWQATLHPAKDLSARGRAPEATTSGASTLPPEVAPSEESARSEPGAAPPLAIATSRSDDVIAPGAPSAPGTDIWGEPGGPRVSAATTNLDEPSESFQIPETPPGLQAFITAGRRPPYSDPFTEPPSEDCNGWDVTEPPAPHATLFDGVRGASLEAQGQRADSDDASSSVPPVSDGAEAAPFCFPGPRLPGQARMPRAMWRRACWRLLETQLSASAASLQDARGRWIGELAPGWFARTLRSTPDPCSARRAFAEQVLRERRLGTYLSRPRCVVLTEEPDGCWIWQVACRLPTLASLLRARLSARPSPSAAAEALLEAALGYLDAHARFIDARVPLPLSPHALSQQDGKIVYSGLMPDPGAAFAEPPGNGYAAFEGALRKLWSDTAVDVQAVLAALHGEAAGRLPEPLLEIIRGVVGQG
jgi:signal recognition particle receptor subunit beta